MIYIWDTNTESSPNFIRPVEDVIFGPVAFSMDGKAIDVLCADGAMRSRSFPEGEKLETVSLDEKDDKDNRFPTSLANFTPDGRYIVGPGFHKTVAAGASIRLWDRKTGKAVRDFTRRSPSVF